MTELREAVMVDFVRTPFGRASKKKPGFFANVRSDDLGIDNETDTSRSGFCG
jgi:hypothetical protein